MSILKVARIAHPVLRTPAQPVPKSAFKDPFFQKLVDDAYATSPDLVARTGKLLKGQN